MRRPSGTVYHFLLPAPDVADYRDKAAKALEPANMERIREWRKEFCKPFTGEQIAELESLSDRVDALWAAHTEQLARDHRETEDSLAVWGQPVPARERRTTNMWKDRIRAQGVFSEGTRTASPFRRLKLVMDYWCALRFPAQQANIRTTQSADERPAEWPPRQRSWPAPWPSFEHSRSGESSPCVPRTLHAHIASGSSGTASCCRS